MKYHAQECVRLSEGAGFVHPPELPPIVHLDDPALDVMTDFNYVKPRTVTPDMPIDYALEIMKNSGVRSLLVVDESDHILGLITSYDIQGERPIDMVNQSRITRSEIHVDMIMTPRDEINALDIATVRRVKVGHIAETLQQLQRRHLLVVETDAEGRHQVCGLFSMSQIQKQLAGHAAKIRTHVHTATIAELAHDQGFGS